MILDMTRQEKIALAGGVVMGAAIVLFIGYDFGWEQGRQVAPNLAYVCGMQDGLMMHHPGDRDALPPKGSPDECAPYRDQVWR